MGEPPQGSPALARTQAINDLAYTKSIFHWDYAVVQGLGEVIPFSRDAAGRGEVDPEF